MSDFTLHVEGLTALQKDLRAASKDALKDFREEELRPIGKMVADTAYLIAKAKGLNDTGQLTRRLQGRGAVRVNNKGVVVTATAKNRSTGYPYPAIYEYGLKRGRPFLGPALDQRQNDVQRLTEHWVSKYLDKHGL